MLKVNEIIIEFVFPIFRRSHPLSSGFWLCVWNWIPCPASGWISVPSALRPSRVISAQRTCFSIKVSFIYDCFFKLANIGASGFLFFCNLDMGGCVFGLFNKIHVCLFLLSQDYSFLDRGSMWVSRLNNL